MDTVLNIEILIIKHQSCSQKFREHVIIAVFRMSHQLSH